MAESFLFSITKIVLGRIASFAEQEIGLAWGVKSELQKLESNLSAIRAILLDAEDRRSKDRQLSDWLEKLKDVVYDVEDVLEDLQYEALRRQVMKSKGIGGKVRNFFSCSKTLLVSRVKMGHGIKEVRERLDGIANERSKFHLTERLEDTRIMHMREMTHSFVRPSDVIGRDDDKDIVIEHLIHKTENGDDVLSIISIVGIGGLGKTALAKLVYNDDRVKENFQIKAWVCVSDEFDVLKLMKAIIKAVNHKNKKNGHENVDVLKLNDYTIDEAQTHLRDSLRGQKFLLILDDVWNEDRGKWDALRELLRDGAIGSRILVTTRSPLVASIMDSVKAHTLKGLPDKDCLSLFVKWAFREGEEKHPPKLMAIGNEIVKKCGGVPLAVKTLGGLLFLKTDERDWLFIKDNEIWKLEQKENDILPALRLSYDKLPSYLKHCFASCSLYPKDFKFTNLTLIQLWMALGLIKTTNDEAQELEEISNRYVNELMSRSFFQDVEDYNFVTEFKMHDLVHDLALQVSQSECMAVNSGTPNKNISKKVRHVSLCDKDLSRKEVPKVLLDLTSLRTILSPTVGVDPTTTSFVETCVSRFKYMRVLDMRYSTFEVLPSSVGDLKHLRLIDLSFNERIKKLPKSLTKLLSLQTLNLAFCSELEELPKDVMVKLINLRALFITTKQVSLEIGCFPPNLRYLWIKKCENLKSLGEEQGGMERLTSLRLLNIYECTSLASLPRGLKYLTTLEHLLIFNCPLITRMDSESEEDTTLPPEKQGMMNPFVALKYLVINDCPELSRRCQPETGEDWPNMFAHVPKITLEFEDVQNII